MDVFVGNLPYRMSARQVEQLIATYVWVDSVRLIQDAVTGRSRGFCFVTVADSAQADEMIGKLDGCEIQGRPIMVASVSGSSF